MSELLNLSQLGSARAEQVAEGLRQYQPNTTPAADAQEAIRAVGTMANLALYTWEAVQQFVGKGVEGGLARELVSEAFREIEQRLSNVRAAIRIIEQGQEKIDSPIPLDELRHLEKMLQRERSSAEQLLAFISEPPPALPHDALERIESIGQADDKTKYLDAEAFLARMRSRKGA